MPLEWKDLSGGSQSTSNDVESDFILPNSDELRFTLEAFQCHIHVIVELKQIA